jgi:hypothetical protein
MALEKRITMPGVKKGFPNTVRNERGIRTDADLSRDGKA